MEPSLKISVVICTANRDASLARTLESIVAAAPPRRATWEVVVVNNGSTDDTDRVIERFRERLPMQRIFEPTRGHSHARNAGVAAATGDYFLWTDDDVTVGVCWMRAYESAFERYPSAAFFGGPIHPRFAGTPPDWLTRGLSYVLRAYAGLDVSAEEIILDPGVHELPYGANMATRAAEQRAFRYNPRLGRQPGPTMLSGEDTNMLRRLVGACASGVWLPDAAVEHRIEPARQTVGYLWQYYRGAGATQAVMAMMQGQKFGWRERVRMSSSATWHEGYYVLGRLLARPDIWLQAITKSGQLRGRLLAHRRGLPADERETTVS